MSVDGTVRQALQATGYKYQDQARGDILLATNQFKDLHISTKMFEFPNRTRRNTVCLVGTIPVNYKGAQYNIPLSVCLWETHPYTSPIVNVTPTQTMVVKPSKFVDQAGRVYLPYLAEWQFPRCDTVGLLQILTLTFADNCPVFARSTQSAGGASAYPVASSAGTPGYPSYPSQSYGQQQPYPAATPYPVASGTTTPQYPAWPNYSQSQQVSGSQTQPSYNTQTSTTSVASSGGTIKPEMIRASLLSAIQDRVKRRMAEKMGAPFAELSSLRNTRDELNAGERRLKAMLAKLAAEQTTMDTTLCNMQDKQQEIERVLACAPNEEDLCVDDAVHCTSPLHKQLMQAYVEDNAIEDAIYFLGQALKKASLPLDSYLKQVRSLSRRQFMARALMMQCRRQAGLNV